MLLQVPVIVQVETGVSKNMFEQKTLDERSQLLMSWLKEVASRNISAHAHTRRKHGEAGAEGGCEEGCGGAGRDAPLVFVTPVMFQLLMSGLQAVLSTSLPS